PGASPVDISGWWVSDATSNYQKYVFPATTVIPAGGFFVIDETDFNPTAGTSPTDFALSSKGDQIYLVEPSGGLPYAFVASQSFDYAPTGVTLGRHTNSVAHNHFVLQSSPTPGAANSGPRIGPAVLSEIMYSPAPGGIAFVEIENVSGGPLQLWDAANPTNTWRINGLAFNFPENTTIQTAEVAIIASTDPATFRAAYPELDPQTLVFGPYAGSLQTDGETVTLQASEPPVAPDTTPYYYDVDKVTYSPLTPWPTPPAGTGPSLERRFADQYGNDPANWQASSEDGGTPGSSNTPATTPEVKVSTRDIIAFGTVGTDAPSQSFDVSNDGINTLTYSISDNANWLTITPPTGTSTNPVDFKTHTVNFDSDGLAGGTHNAVITVSDPNALNSPQTIDVSITISAPEIALSNTALQFAAATNEPIASTTIQIWNEVGDTTLDYSVASDVAWLTVTPGNGSSSGPGDRRDHTLGVSTAGLPNGQYVGHITVASPIATNNSQVLTVTLNITDDVLVNLDARTLPTGPLASWSNLGLLGGNFTAERDTPRVTDIAGARGVTLDGSRDWYVGPVAPPAVIGNNPHTVEAWIYNPTISPSETIAAWSREAWVEGAALGLRTDNLLGADFTGEIPGPNDSLITALNVDSEALGNANGIDLSGDNFDWVFTFSFYDADGKFSFTENFDDKVLLDIDKVVSNTDSTVVGDGTPHSDSGWNARTFANFDFASSGWFSATLYLTEDGGGAQSAGGIGIGYSNAPSTSQESQYGGIGYDPSGGSQNPAVFDLDTSTGNRFGTLLSDGSSNNMRFNHGTSTVTGAALRDGGSDLGWNGDQEGGIWTFVSLAYDGAGNTSVYTNGSLSHTLSHNPLSLQEDSTDDSQLRFVIGNHNRADGTRADAAASSMTISVLRIYDRELSAGAIENNYNLDAIAFGRTPTQGVDTDADGLSDADEATNGTDPTNPDSDGDGMLDGAEIFAGTNPLDPNSVFAIISTDPGFVDNLVLVTWVSSPGKQYIIQYSTDLQPGNWIDLNNGDPVSGRAGATTTSFADATPGATTGTRLYRIILQIP
ncbi:MAG: lamin tail domain-containing protein, partial [Verrucomicrobiales bacterium]|nr:lamin tail domain-containing protein [Verrucomicrobiales bacterium]